MNQARQTYENTVGNIPRRGEEFSAGMSQALRGTEDARIPPHLDTINVRLNSILDRINGACSVVEATNARMGIHGEPMNGCTAGKPQQIDGAIPLIFQRLDEAFDLLERLDRAVNAQLKVV